ncbi:MAG: hypothetical protein P8Y73_11665, partial [Desulfuromonadales bacterium]
MLRKLKWPRAVLFTVLALVVGLLVLPEPMNATTQDELDQNRARLLTYVLRRQVENHFSGKPLDDNLSKAAFELYIKQMDFQKRLFLAAEVDQLAVFADRIDDEIKSGRIVLAPIA